MSVVGSVELTVLIESLDMVVVIEQKTLRKRVETDGEWNANGRRKEAIS